MTSPPGALEQISGPSSSDAAENGDGINWSLCTWKGSRREQHRRFLALPFRRKLELVEELCDFARWTMENRRRRGLPYRDPSTGEIVRAAVPAPPPPAGTVVTSQSSAGD